MNPLKIISLALISVVMLIAGCGGSTTTADRPDNLTGTFTGTVALSGNGNAPASLTIIQGSSTQEGGEGTDPVATQTITGSLVVTIDSECRYVIAFSSGVQTASSSTLTGDSGSMTLNSSAGVLTGSLTYTGAIATRGEDGDNCPVPQGAVRFS